MGQSVIFQGIKAGALVFKSCLYSTSHLKSSKSHMLGPVYQGGVIGSHMRGSVRIMVKWLNSNAFGTFIRYQYQWWSTYVRVKHLSSAYFPAF